MKSVYSVSKVNEYIKALIDEDVLLGNIYVEGEISNFKEHISGHLYFTLKDSGGAMNCVMFRSSAVNMKFRAENGMKVIVGGYISIYEKTGSYQLYARSMEKAGKGDLYAEFERLKKELEKRGIFDEKHKKKLPEYPKCIAVITSATGAAVRDIIRVTGRRNKNVKIAVRPTLVQGENAADDIVNAIKEINEWKNADVIILGRGGGSIEDLWAFNEEKVARAIYESKIPIISAVGHETDFTIADFASDVRAATPSMAGELAVKESMGTREKLENMLSRIEREVERNIENKKRRLEYFIKSAAMRKPYERICNSQMYVGQLQRKMTREIEIKTEKEKIRLASIADSLEKVSPISILKRGYSIAYKDNVAIRDISGINSGDEIKIYVEKGTIYADVTRCEKNG